MAEDTTQKPAMYTSKKSSDEKVPSVVRSLSQLPETVNPPMLYTLDSESQRVVVQGRKSSVFFVSEDYESLDYSPLTNEIELERQKAETYCDVKRRDCLRVLLLIAIGAVIALIGFLLEVTSEELGHLKFDMFEQMAMEDYSGRFEEFSKFVVYRFAGVLVPVMISAALVVFLEPHAAGGGVAQCVGYLNGIRVPHVLSFRVLVIKFLSTSFTVISGLAGGKEGPMMHIGAIAGGGLPSVLPWLEFTLDNERRDLAAAGFGAGLSVVFGAPIGGMLLAFEEGVSYMEIALMFKIYLCCVVSYVVGSATVSLFHKGTVELNHIDLLSLGYIGQDVTRYEYFELIPFTFMAFIGGLIGALITVVHIKVVVFKNQYLRTKARQMLACFIAAIFVTVVQVSAIWFVRNCSAAPARFTMANATAHQPGTQRMFCAKGEQSDMSVLLSMSQGNVMRQFFSPNPIQMSSLALFSVMYLVLLCMTMGLSVSAGIFIPQIILGAAWGRMFGMFLKRLSGDASWARPAKYAYLGAAAQLSGTVGKTFSILVIFVEASGSTHLSLPLMVIVSITKAICMFFVTPLYEAQMHMMGMPLLPPRPPPLACDIPVSRCMSRPPVTLPRSPTVVAIMNVLISDDHNGYPVVGLGHPRPQLLGLVLRQQLLMLLKYHAYKLPPPTTLKQMSECHETYAREAGAALDEEDIVDGVPEEFYLTTLDLSPYYNCYPATVPGDLPMVKAYELFRGLGLRHLVVVSKSYEPLGMITRKDLAKFHVVEHWCRLNVKQMLVRR